MAAMDASSAPRRRRVPLRVGVFCAPFHPLDEDPTLALERDLEFAAFADRLGVAEFWFGEHHSGGYEISASPELMIAAAASRTHRIHLGTGVISVPYHHPLNVAQRIAQLSHLTRGRLLFGAGPGLLAADAHMRGLDPRLSRERLDQALGAILRLLAGEWVTERTDWYELRDAHCQLLPHGSLEVCVASTFSPSGGRLAAKYDAGLLCLAATQPGGYDALSHNWAIARQEAEARGRTLDPARLRLATDIHVAETRDQAMDQVRKGYLVNRRYFENQTGHLPETGVSRPLEALIESGEVVVGTPDDAIAQIRRLEEKVPDFGCLLLFDKNWASMEHKCRSLEMVMRYVVPAINGDNDNRVRSFTWQGEHRERFFDLTRQGVERAFARHRAEAGETDPREGESAP
ncbi:MAG: monooxygenase [Porticoccaceae bacterium]|nr:MAG: monooxygenase [Porticoccaceae bacterium]